MGTTGTAALLQKTIGVHTDHKEEIEADCYLTGRFWRTAHTCNYDGGAETVTCELVDKQNPPVNVKGTPMCPTWFDIKCKPQSRSWCCENARVNSEMVQALKFGAGNEQHVMIKDSDGTCTGCQPQYGGANPNNDPTAQDVVGCADRGAQSDSNINEEFYYRLVGCTIGGTCGAEKIAKKS